MKRFCQNILLVALCLSTASVGAQNLAGMDFTTMMGQPDPTLACEKTTGDNGTVRFFRDGVAGACPDKMCFNQNLTCGAYCLWDQFALKNIVNIPLCITVNINAGACGVNVFSAVFGSPYNIPTGGATWCDANPSHISDGGSSGTISYSFERGCTPFYIVNSPVNLAAACSYTMNISTDPLLDLRCASDPVACIEKVKIGGTPVPTMTQWGLFLFGLIVLTLGVVTIYNMSTSRATERS